MPLNKVQLKTKLIAIFSNPDVNSNIETVAEAMANAIDEYVRTGTVVGVDSEGDALTNGQIT